MGEVEKCLDEGLEPTYHFSIFKIDNHDDKKLVCTCLFFVVILHSVLANMSYSYTARINSLINDEIEDSLSSIDSNEDIWHLQEDSFELVPDPSKSNQSYGEIPSLETVRGVVILALCILLHTMKSRH